MSLVGVLFNVLRKGIRGNSFIIWIIVIPMLVIPPKGVSGMPDTSGPILGDTVQVVTGAVAGALMGASAAAARPKPKPKKRNKGRGIASHRKKSRYNMATAQSSLELNPKATFQEIRAAACCT